MAESNSKPERKPQGTTGHQRTEARLLAVQAIYQVLLLRQSTADVLAEFSSYRIPGTGADSKLFSKIYEHAIADEERYQTLLTVQLSKKWSWDRLGLVEKAILLAAAAEMDVCQTTPPKVIINEFLNIAHSFFEADEVSFVNGVLDKVRQAVRD